MTDKLFDANILETKLQRFRQHWLEGPQEFEASIDSITRGVWKSGKYFSRFRTNTPTHVLHLGEGIFPDYLEHIYLLQMDSDVKRLARLFEEGHEVTVTGQYVAGDASGEFKRRISPNENIILDFVSSFLFMQTLRDIYNAQFTVKDKSSGDVLLEYDAQFSYIYPVSSILSPEEYDPLLIALPSHMPYYHDS